MRHKIKKFQLNRFTSWRKSTLKSLARSLLIHQSIKTTHLRAKAVKPLVERLISLAKLNTLTARRQAAKILNDHKIVSLLFNEIGPRFSKYQGGYTRIINLGARRGDNASIVIFELTEIKEKKAKKTEKGIESKEELTEMEKPSTQKQPEIKPEAGPVKVKEKERPPITKKPTKKFLGGLRSIFKKERDAL